MLCFAGLLLAGALVAWLVPQEPLGTPIPVEDLRASLPGLFTTKDVFHSAVFLVAGLGLVIGLSLTAVDRLLADRRPDLGALFEGIFWVGLVGVLVLSLVHVFTYREVEIPLGPGEAALVPSMDLTIRAGVTGWTPEAGSFATVEAVRRLAGSDLAGPFGEQDRPSDARLAADSVDLQIGAGADSEIDGLRLRSRAGPSEWAAAVTVSYQGREASSPFLRSGQSWMAASLFADPALTVGMDRVIPEFDPTVSIILQPLGGPPEAPAAVVTLAQANDMVGSRAFAPGDKAVMGDFVVLLERYAPVVTVVASTRSFAFWILLAFGVAAVGGCGRVLSGLIARRQKEASSVGAPQSTPTG